MRIAALLVFFAPLFSHAQLRQQPDAATIKLELKKLNSLGAVLYLAAHPDDENSRAIAFLVNDQLMTTGYLSLTRGDGGQNLIGPEIRDMLGLLRTQELLSARRIDGGEQFFTRAIDFGFSKSAKETFEIWNEREVLSDVVRVIRQFQPDVILTRFPPDERAGHGQHTASAALAQEAFEKTNDPTVFPDQVKQYGVWQVKRLFINTGRWWNQTINEASPGVVTMNVGTYNPLLGKSYSELAAESRTQHKSQGFGVPARRGDAPEYFELANGEKPEKNILDGVNTTWSRVKGGEKVQPLVERAIREFNEERPASSVPLLLQIRQEIVQLEPGVWKTRKLNEVNQLIQNCLGLFAEVTADNFWVSPGEPMTTSYEILNRSDTEVKLLGMAAPDLLFDTLLTTSLKNNSPFVFKRTNLLKADKSYSSPYWLTEPHGPGLFNVSDRRLIGKPENDPAVVIYFTVAVNGEKLRIPCPVIYKWTDPVKGELVRPVEVVPPLFLNLPDKVILFPNSSPKEIAVLVKSASGKDLNGTVTLSLPAGWKSEPASVPFELRKRGEEGTVTFNVTPGKGNLTASVKAIAEWDGRKYDRALQLIEYSHIPIQTLLPNAGAKVVRLDLSKEGEWVGYIRGAGDEIPAALKNMGYRVWEMKDEEVTPENLKKLDAVVLGVRAVNTNERIRHFMPDLFEYIKNGGTMIAQYNTNSDLEMEAGKIAPYPLSLSRDRVTEENSEVTILKPDHPALNYPNKIDAKDFDGWVQERGLYFPDKWDPHFEALLSCHDAGEPAREGSLLIANYGSGYYVYTGLSFFRELPEGVPGAYRLFANLVSLGKNKKPERVNGKSKAK
jgi:LmbE family N-acetylglucosaminyl deacetylase